MTGSNVINILKVGGGLCPPGAKAFLLVTDNRRSRLDSPFCVITQHMKFEFGHHHHRQSKKITNAQDVLVPECIGAEIVRCKTSFGGLK